ncbi:MAG: hypothetical protein HY924_16830 [Elusimicrobia bacterium]|nr:hypothetical protein [Elusimicrobiota bacterium]
MFLRFFRIAATAALIYLFFRVGYPLPGHQLYHMLVVLGILVAAAVLTVGLQLVEFASTKAPLVLEALFAGAVLVGLGFTMPARRGPILPQLLQGRFPTESSVREGLGLIGMDPKSETSQRIIKLFPR